MQMVNKAQPAKTPPLVCDCGAAFPTEEEYLIHVQIHDDQPKTNAEAIDSPEGELDTSSGGEQGQTEEERREWEHVQRKDAEENRK
jgi:hypothetical protein